MNLRAALLPTLFVACCLPAARLSAQGEFALRGAAIETVDRGRIENGVIVVREGKILTVGDANVKVPETARVYDMSGSVIMPGIIDPYHVVRLSSTTSAPRVVVINGRRITIPSSSSTTAFAKIGDSFYPYTFRSRTMLRTGVTHFNLVAPGYGQSAVARNTPDKPESLLVSSNGIMYAAVTNSSTALSVLRSGLRPSSSSRRSSSSSSRSRTVSPAAALWKEVQEGKRRLIVNAQNAAGILHLLELLEPHKNVKLTLVATGRSVYQTLDAIKRRKPMLVLQPTIDLQPNSALQINVPRIVDKAGLPMAFSLSFSASQLSASQDAPLFRVALLVRAGLSRKSALAALTIRPAEILGLEKTHGTISNGKLANLLVFDGDPLDPSSQLRKVYVEGNKVYEN